MAGFLDLYGGYADLSGLLDELRRFGVDLDPMQCHPFELYAYLVWCIVSAVLTAVGAILFVRDPSKRVLFRQTVVLPAMLYTPILLGFMLSCLGSQQTQEPGFGICLLVIEPLLCFHMMRLIRDARRRGLNARVFDMPLSVRNWRFLLFSLFFHAGLCACGAVVVGYSDGPGRLLLALEASLRLRSVRPHPTVCPEAEIGMHLVLLGTCCVIVLIGHSTVSRTKAAAPYRTAWKVGVTIPTAAQGLAVGLSLLTCYDTESSTELITYYVLIALQALTLAEVSRRVYRSPGDATRWLYIGLVPYHATTMIATTTCLLSYLVDGPLMAEDFVVLWERDPPPGSVNFVFFSLCLLHLVALLSTVLFDPDEGDRELTEEELAVLEQQTEDRERRKRLLRRAQQHRTRFERSKKFLAALRAIGRGVSRQVRPQRARPQQAPSARSAAGPLGSSADDAAEFGVPPPPVRPSRMVNAEDGDAVQMVDVEYELAARGFTAGREQHARAAALALEATSQATTSTRNGSGIAAVGAEDQRL